MSLRNQPSLSSTTPQSDTYCVNHSLLKIGEVANLAGMTLRTLRYYEELGLIEPDNRTKGNFRLYSPMVIRKLQFITSLKKLDFTLDEISELLGHNGDTPLSDKEIVDRTRAALSVKRQKITEKLLELEEMKHEVEVTLKFLDECLSCKQQTNNSPCDPDCEKKSNLLM